MVCFEVCKTQADHAVGSSTSRDHPLGYCQADPGQYYAQQGYDAATIAQMTGQPSAEASSSSTAYNAGGTTGTPSGYTTINPTPASGGGGARVPAGTQYLDGDLLQQQSVYLPGAVEKMKKEGTYKPPQAAGRRETVIRKGNGKTWEDQTLLDWDPSELTTSLKCPQALHRDLVMSSHESNRG